MTIRGFRVELLDWQGRATAVFAFAQEYVRVGSDSSCEVAFPDADMAPVHGLIRSVQDRHLIAAGDSMRVLTINGGMVQGAVDLRPGDVIQAGSRRLRFLPDAVPAQAPGLPAVDGGSSWRPASPTPPTAPQAPAASPLQAPPAGGAPPPGRSDDDRTLPSYSLAQSQAHPTVTPHGTPYSQGGGASGQIPGGVAAYGQDTYIPPPPPVRRSPMTNPAVRASFIFMMMVLLLAAAKLWFFDDIASEEGKDRPRVKSVLPEVVGTKGGKTDDEIQTNADREYQIGLKRLEAHNLKDENLQEAILHFTETERLLKLLPHETPLLSQAQAKQKEARQLQDEKYGDARFRYLQLIRLGQYKDAKVELERMLKILSDPKDPRFLKVEHELNTFEDTMKANR